MPGAYPGFEFRVDKNRQNKAAIPNVLSRELGTGLKNKNLISHVQSQIIKWFLIGENVEKKIADQLVKKFPKNVY